MNAITEEKHTLNDLAKRQPIIPIVNHTVRMGHPQHCGVLIAEEYLRGQIRVHIGNMYSGIEPDCEKLDFSTLEELFANWRID